MSSRKYAPETTWADVHHFVEQHTQETGYHAVVQVYSFSGPRAYPYVQVTLLPLGEESVSRGTLTVRDTWPVARPATQVRVVLHLVARAYAELQDNPWLWTPDRRAAARGE